MKDIAIKETLGKLPVEELETSIETYLKPMIKQVPDKRLQGVICLSIQGILGSESPVVTQIAQSVARTKSSVWAAAKRVYRFLKNERFSHNELASGLYEISRLSVEQEAPAYVVVALDPVNFEKVAPRRW